MPRKTKRESSLSLTVNGHTITGEYQRGRWTFACESFPELAVEYSGLRTLGFGLGAIIPEFLTRTIDRATQPPYPDQ